MSLDPHSVSGQLQPRGVTIGGPPSTPFTATDLEREHIAQRAVVSLGEQIVGAVDYFRAGGMETLDCNLDHEGLPTLLRRHHSVVRLRISQLASAPQGTYTLDVSAVTSDMLERLESRVMRACFARRVVLTSIDHRLGSTTFTFRSDAPQPPRVPEGFSIASGY